MRVYVYEHGAGVRPGQMLSEFDRDGRAMCLIEFSDERGGRRNCFKTSISPDRKLLEKINAPKTLKHKVRS